MDVSKEVCELISVPAHIEACANAVRHDLLYGPTYAVVPEDLEEFTGDDYYSLYQDALEEAGEADVEEVYTGRVGDALRAFCEALPSELYYEDWSGCVQESEPEGYWEDDEEWEDEDEEGVAEKVWIEPEPYTVIDSRAIVEALFGRTIAREFN